MRAYVIICGHNPIQCFVADEGFARFAPSYVEANEDMLGQVMTDVLTSMGLSQAVPPVGKDLSAAHATAASEVDVDIAADSPVLKANQDEKRTWAALLD